MYRRRLVSPLANQSPYAIAITAIVLFAQLALLGIYLWAIDAAVSAYLVYPIVWITVSCWVLLHARAQRASARRHLLAGLAAGAYFLLVAYLSGMIGINASSTPAESFAGGFRVAASAPPGYAPAALYVGETVTLALIPYLLVGYVTLSYLVYITILEAWAATAPGLLGLFGCIGCSWPIFAALATGTGGTVGSIAGAVYANAYPLSTIAFLLAVGLLYWRPSISSLRQWRRILE